MINEAKLDKTMLELGHDDRLRGAEYLRDAVRRYEPGMLLTKELYPAIAAAHGSTTIRVERCMRNSIEKAWMRGSEEARLRYFGFSYDLATARPTVGEYVARMARICREGIEY